MDNIINLITSNTLYLVIAIIICIMVVIAIVKKFMKLFLAALVVLGLYIGFLVYTGQNVPTDKAEILDHTSKKYEMLKEKGKEAMDKANEEIEKQKK
ncbi:MAG: hypothetical protein GY754_46935 [bacterium]|nr:hypothetical protein [bacterium]